MLEFMSLVSPRPLSNPRSPRIRINVESQIDAHELNQLFIKVGKPVQDVAKLRCALEHSLFCVTARLITGRLLIGFARTNGDGVFNAAILDWVVDPTVNNPDAVRRQLIERVKLESRRTMPQCAISLFAEPTDHAILRRAGFDEEPNGIKAMML
ncbi:MAG: hypothetical protein HC857_07880 [Synechococcales cyanobacterium RU_4_20]|nr:hypothetical protein [Synechococcales cyanobacterium RU_4_20]